MIQAFFSPLKHQRVEVDTHRGMRIYHCLFPFLVFLITTIQGCEPTESATRLETYDDFRTQKIEYRDSLFILYTVKDWAKKNWYTFEDYSLMYKMTNDQVEYYFGGTFYSPDKKKMLVWIGEKIPNLETKERYNSEIEANRLCPNGGNFIHSMSAVVCTRDSINSLWKVYPLNLQQATCYETKEKVLNVLGQYYFIKMKDHPMYHMLQSGESKGKLKLIEYGYNLQDYDFWDKCWLFQKDTVGSHDLYTFQIKGYSCDKEDYNRLLNSDPNTHKPYPNNEMKPFKNDLKDCAEPYNPPITNYPDYIIKLYSQTESKKVQ